MGAVDVPGAMRLVVLGNVRALDPAAAMFQAMLKGWEQQQQSRLLAKKTISDRLSLVRRFADYTGTYPWEWNAEDMEAYFSTQMSRELPLAHSTVRGQQNDLQLFCTLITDGRYGWAAACQEEFGQVPAQICHDWNTADHVAEFEGNPGRRALTYDELQALFDAADDRVEQARKRRRKGVLAAWRDAVLLKSVYTYGTRRRETSMLDLHDLRHNPRAKDYGRFGALEVRFGKAPRGSPSKRRTVLTVPEMDWIVPLLEEWVDEVRGRFGAGKHPALWVTERCGRLGLRRLDEVFALVRQHAGLPEELELHSLRHSYITHLIEFGYPERFVQDQVGHRYASTTALYTWVSDEYRNRLLEDSLARRVERMAAREEVGQR
ncbi:tyrosine-type recombinase/integrase [Streptomyces spirodelae]|uniref:Tyrosine-type recombinase/integrase n=1 Tax=Streptomyces spirodelae TaxID=2812904 RepID=A0ABS3X3V8_9ACTN|nr:tyrosine-type recombinase/integrase [Streptomyces spirodelae]MBO8190063.1 tyrosine-type recombinase/integrase [Streptomyces spirodelae]